MPQEQNNSETILAIDYGETNIGLAFGRNGLVTPLKIISEKRDDEAIYEIGRYIMENKVPYVVVGLPLSIDGKETPQSRKVRRFAKLLKIKTKRPVEFINEFRTTADLPTEDISLGITKNKYGKVDHLSAALILREFFSKQD